MHPQCLPLLRVQCYVIQNPSLVSLLLSGFRCAYMSDGTAWQEGGLAVTASTTLGPRLPALHPAAFSLVRAVEGVWWCRSRLNHSIELSG